jgi:hypothetical protein
MLDFSFKSIFVLFVTFPAEFRDLLYEFLFPLSDIGHMAGIAFALSIGFMANGMHERLSQIRSAMRIVAT